MIAIFLIAAGIARTIFAFKAGSFGKGVLAFVLGALYALLYNLISSDNAAIFLIVWIAAAFCYSLVFWQFATYEAMPIERTSS